MVSAVHPKNYAHGTNFMMFCCDEVPGRFYLYQIQASTTVKIYPVKESWGIWVNVSRAPIRTANKNTTKQYIPTPCTYKIVTSQFRHLKSSAIWRFVQCFFSWLHKRKHQCSASLGLCAENPPVTVDSPYKGQSNQKTLQYNNSVISLCNVVLNICSFYHNMIWDVIRSSISKRCDRLWSRWF